jgi:hypothetical protein
MLTGLLVEEHHTVLRPVLPQRDEHKLAPSPRMERMSQTDSSSRTVADRRS